jgi:putative membrane-bound dehydrogenase-like protein
MVRRTWTGLLASALLLCIAGPMRADDDIGLAAPPGFEISLYADDSVAHDVYSLTIDAKGRVVVSGQGYVRILIDADGDGRAETFKQFADGPGTGAQGLYFHGKDLLCTGDQGLLRYRDQNGDDRADGAPDVFLKLKAGGEHDSHAIRKGPDGFWYLISGNMTQVGRNYVTLASSPVTNPQQGTVMRLSSDLTRGEVVSHGYRNAYDFDFGPDGEVFVFDSDGEREISLPSYLPTRVFEAVPGSHAGWLAANWKRPGYFFDMPPVVAELGRGSPTGVVCYRHSQFPKEYRGNLIVLDWTYGRVFSLPLERQGSAAISQPVKLIWATGENGFAPTDAEVGPDGSLFVSIGGRGTRGSVYRLRWVGGIAAAPEKDALASCLNAPMPLCSWSRARWEPKVEELGEASFDAAARDVTRPTAQRVRAIEILTEKFAGLNQELAEALSTDRDEAIRARTAWSLGRTSPDAEPLLRFLGDSSPLVQRRAVEAILGADPLAIDSFAPYLTPCLSSPDKFVRMGAARVLARAGNAAFQKASEAARLTGWDAAVPIAVAYAERHGGYQAYSVDVARRILAGKHSPALKFEAARLLEIGLGDAPPRAGSVPEAFEGYASREDLTSKAADLQPVVAALVELLPSGQSQLDTEIGRCLAMIQPADPAVLEKVVSRLTPTSSPVDDLHWLSVAARLPAPRSELTRQSIASYLLRLEVKIKERSLPLDSSWDDRVREIFQALVENDPGLPLAMLQHPDFGRAGHVTFIAAMPPDSFPAAVAAFLRQIQADPEYPWTSEVIFLLSHAEDPAVRAMVKEKFDDLSLRNAVLLALSEEPMEEDREKFVLGIENSPLDVLGECVKALLLLDSQPSDREQVSLVRALRRLGDTGREREIRDQIVEILQRDNEQRLSYILGQDGVSQQPAIDEWTNLVREKYPDEFARQSGESQAELAQLKKTLGMVDWAAGDGRRGEKLFESRACVQCHGNRRALGPDLNGAAQRFSRDDLFTAIAIPSRDVSPRYQTTMVATKEGAVYTGLVVYESVDGMVLRNAANQTFRIETRNIEARKTLSESLMPNGLLKDLKPGDLADLYAYLRSLSARTTVAAEAEDRE